MGRGSGSLWDDHRFRAWPGSTPCKQITQRAVFDVGLLPLRFFPDAKLSLGLPFVQKYWGFVYSSCLGHTDLQPHPIALCLLLTHV